MPNSYSHFIIFYFFLKALTTPIIKAPLKIRAVNAIGVNITAINTSNILTLLNN